MDGCYGQHGWKEFQRNRKNILAEFDKIIEQTSNRPVRTAHGPGVEAYIRKWLSEFLPKKYGVTSGYIIPNLYDDTGNIYHFDIIIYNQLDAPVLWTEGNEDNSEQGKYRAIPARYVVAVYEVKSRITKKTVSEALEKLGQTKLFQHQLSENYNCGVIFIDLKEKENESGQIIKELHKGKSIFGFSGGMVLRYEGDTTSTGLIFISKLDHAEPMQNTHYTPLAKRIDDLNIFQTEDGSIQISEQGAGTTLVRTSEDNWSISKSYGVHHDEDGMSAYLIWSRSNFSKFCVNLLSALEGLPYNDKNRPSFGMIFDRIRLERAPLQPPEPVLDYPFLSISLHSGGGSGEKFLITHEADSIIIEFWVAVENEGCVEANISDDMFQNYLALPGKMKAVKSTNLAVQFKKRKLNIEDILNSEGLEIPYRLVYSFGKDEKKLYAVEKKIKILGSSIDFI